MKRGYWIVACAIFGLNTSLMAEQVVPESSAVMPDAAKPADVVPVDVAAVEAQPEVVQPEPAAPVSAVIEPQAEQAITPIQRATPPQQESTVADQPAIAEPAEQAPVQPIEQAVEPEPVEPAVSTVDTPAASDVVDESSAQAISPELIQTTAPVAPQAEVSSPDTGLGDCGELAQRSQLELDKLQVYVAEVNKRLEKLRKELNAGEQKRRQQAVLIDFFEQELQSLRKRNPERSELVNAAFNELSAQLPESPVFRVEDNRLIIMTDFTLVFGRGEVSTEGETRLQLIANALRRVGSTMPADANWRWRVEGHSDSQPLRSITWFPSNWELSAARASGIARYLIGQGIPAERMRVAALGATQPIEPNAQTKDEHWRNRRVEIHLSLERS